MRRPKKRVGPEGWVNDEGNDAARKKKETTTTISWLRLMLAKNLLR
jgi:hypothetical protein